MRILVADDNQDAADSLGLLLRLWGYEVRIVYDGLSALKTAHHFRPSVVLLDIQMPNLHGGEVARRLRQLPGFEGVLVVATSANNPDDSRLAGYNDLFDAH